MDVDDDIKACLNYDDPKIRSLELPVLKKIMPVFEHKLKTESKALEKLEKDRNQLRRTLDGLEMEKVQLEKLMEKKFKIYEELETRGSTVKRELAKTKVICPVYEVRMNMYLAKLSDNDKPKPKDDTNGTHLLQLEKNLIKRKKDLEVAVKENQEKIDKFVEKYLDQFK